MTKLPEPNYYVTFAADASIIHNPYYTAAQLQAYGEACRKEAIAECLEITKQWGPLGEQFAQTLKELK